MMHDTVGPLGDSDEPYDNGGEHGKLGQVINHFLFLT
jgi:hypothetical protein